MKADSFTVGQQFNKTIVCNTKEEAEEWLEQEVKNYVEDYGHSPEEAVKIIKSNLGYMAGYYDDATARKIDHLFNSKHPIFGTSTYHKVE